MALLYSVPDKIVFKRWTSGDVTSCKKRLLLRNPTAFSQSLFICAPTTQQFVLILDPSPTGEPWKTSADTKGSLTIYGGLC